VDEAIRPTLGFRVYHGVRWRKNKGCGCKDIIIIVSMKVVIF
jgi:hypothetical protein